MTQPSVHNGTATCTCRTVHTTTGPKSPAETAAAAAACHDPDDRTLGPRLVTTDHAASMLAVSKRTVYELMSRDELHSVTIGRSRRIPVSAIEAYIADRIGGAA